MEEFKPFAHFATKALHEGQDPEQWKCKAVVPLISMSATFKLDTPGLNAAYIYSRVGNPTRAATEKCLASLEDAKHGVLFASGLSAAAAMTSLLRSGDHIVASSDLYGGTYCYFENVAKRQGIVTTYVDVAIPGNLRTALQPNTKMVWIESPTNPMMILVDIEAVCEIAHQQPGVLVVVDNTLMSSYFQRPLTLGADVVMHSLTKYMNGHSDTVTGALITNNDKLGQELKFLQYAIGAVPSHFDCYLVNRGVKTLHLRMREHMKNGLALAQHLQNDRRIEKVLHPGLPSHPQYELGKKQMRGYSGMFSFYIEGGLEQATKFLQSLKVIALAFSLGGYESLAEHPYTMTHACIPEEEREAGGISNNLIRFSTGLEDIEDIITDIEQALNSTVDIEV